MYKKIGEYEALTKEYNGESDRLDADLRDTGKKVQKFETRMEETMEKLQASAAKMEEAEKDFKDKDDDVNNQSRRVMLLEEEARINVEKLATTVLKLAVMSKDADNIVKGCRHWESKTMNNDAPPPVMAPDLNAGHVGGGGGWAHPLMTRPGAK